MYKRLKVQVLQTIHINKFFIFPLNKTVFKKYYCRFLYKFLSWNSKFVAEKSAKIRQHVLLSKFFISLEFELQRRFRFSILKVNEFDMFETIFLPT